MTTTSGKRRSRTEIVIQILEAAVNDCGEDGDGVTKTTLMYDVFLNSNQLKEYLAALTAYGLLRYDSSMRTYDATEKGLRFLGLWYNMSNMANELQRQAWIEREGGEEEF